MDLQSSSSSSVVSPSAAAAAPPSRAFSRNLANRAALELYGNTLCSLLHSYRCRTRPCGGSDCRTTHCLKSSSVLRHTLLCEKRGGGCSKLCNGITEMLDYYTRCPPGCKCPLCVLVDGAPCLREWQCFMDRSVRDSVVEFACEEIASAASDDPVLREYICSCEAVVFAGASTQDHYFASMADAAFRVREAVLASPPRRRRLPYDPDASAGDQGPPNVTAPAPTPPTPPPPPPPPPPRVDQAELRTSLTTLVDALRSDANAGPFLEPVDPVKLRVPDYLQIVKRPMDLQTIRAKLQSDAYGVDARAFVDDVCLMFSNAFLFNKKISKVYKMCARLKEAFEAAVDEPMRALGYCCGQKLDFAPQSLYCYGGSRLCPQIKRFQPYHCYTNDHPRPNLNGSRYPVCAKCFDAVRGSDVEVGDDAAEPKVALPKSAFVLLRNDVREEEPVVVCVKCARTAHQICALYHEGIDKKPFVCQRCRGADDVPAAQPRFSASKLPHNRLSRHIEGRLAEMFRARPGHEHLADRVHVRVLSSFDKVFEVRERMREYYGGHHDDGGPAAFPYRAKAVFVFEEIEGVDVAFFAMHVHEYGHTCPQPNTNRVYISYLDSVYYFQPRELRTDVYHRVLIAYMEHARALGFQFAHIWACPPGEGDDYIFYCHPPTQKVPKQKRLADWYRAMVDKAIDEGVCVDVKDVITDMVLREKDSARHLPYFDGDFFANAIEDELKTMFNSCKDKGLPMPRADGEDNGNGIDGRKRKGGTSLSRRPKTARTSRRSQMSRKYFECTDTLTEKVLVLMERYRDVFFVIQLQPDSYSADGPPRPITDLDPLVSCDMMDGRDSFLNFCRERNYEYSTLRRSKFTTMVFLYELLTQGVVSDDDGDGNNGEFCYSCNECSTGLTTARYSCAECDDFDLCVGCYGRIGHQHPMERKSVAGVAAVAEEPAQPEAKPDSPPPPPPPPPTLEAANQEHKQKLIQMYVESMLHAIECRNANCRWGACRSMKTSLEHVQLCRRNNYPNIPRGECSLCQKLYALAYAHSRTCRDTECPFPFCPLVKSKVQQQRNMSNQMDQRRMYLMLNEEENTSSSPTTTNPPQTPASTGGSSQQQQQQQQTPMTVAHSNQSQTSATKRLTPPVGGKDWALQSRHYQQQQQILMRTAMFQQQQQQQYRMRQPIITPAQFQHPRISYIQQQQQQQMCAASPYQQQQMMIARRPPPPPPAAADQANMTTNGPIRYYQTPQRMIHGSPHYVQQQQQFVGQQQQQQIPPHVMREMMIQRQREDELRQTRFRMAPGQQQREMMMTTYNPHMAQQQQFAQFQQQQQTAFAQQQQMTPFPQQQTPFPQQQTPFPQQQTPFPQQQTPFPQQQTPYPQQQTPFPQQQTPFPQQQTPFPQQQTPFPQQQTPYPQQQLPPGVSMHPHGYMQQQQHPSQQRYR